MALSQSALSELLEVFRAGEGVDLIREAVRVALQDLIELEASEVIGAGRYERSESRLTERNGSRPRVLTTKAGDVQLAIPKLRKGSFFPEILEPRRRIDQALHAVVMEAYVHGVSTRSVDDLVAALGGSGMSKSQVSRICAGLDETVGAFRSRTLGHAGFPYVFLDATYLHVRETSRGQVVSKAVVVATGVTEHGTREILGLDVGDSEDETFWRKFLTDLKDRGLSGVRLVVSDQHAGLVKALRRCFAGAGAPTLPGPLRPEPARAGPPQPQGHGRRAVPHDLRPARRESRPRHVGRGPRPARQAVPEDRAAHGRRQGRGPGLHRVPAGALDQDLVQQPHRAGQQGDQETLPRGADLPQRARRHPPRRSRPGRRPRRMAGLRPPLPLRSIHGAAEHSARY
jgi:putative transposase